LFADKCAADNLIVHQGTPITMRVDANTHPGVYPVPAPASAQEYDVKQHKNNSNK
jgi:hypothetical protein